MIFINDMYVKNNNKINYNNTINYPHACPVWRKNLHNIVGFFNEKEYGTYADYEFWIRCLKNDLNIVCASDYPLYFYYINQNSHNRENKNEITMNNILEKYGLM